MLTGWRLPDDEPAPGGSSDDEDRESETRSREASGLRGVPLPAAFDEPSGRGRICGDAGGALLSPAERWRLLPASDARETAPVGRPGAVGGGV